MRAQCCICADLFVSSSQDIAAAPCGHVFHEACLMRWMDTSSTCPSCRTHVKKKQLITRLFFDISEEVDADEDVSRFKNQLSDLSAQLKEKSRKVTEAEESRDKFQVLLAVAELKQEEVSAKLLDEKRLTDMLKAENKTINKENKCYIEEIRHLRNQEKKLVDLQAVETVLKGSSKEAEEVLQRYMGEGDAAIKQLTSLLTVMKREYNQALSDKRSLKEQLVKLKREVGWHKMQTGEKKKEMANLAEELESTKSILCEKERENDENRRKIVHLRRALRENKKEGSESFVAAITEDSPNVAFTPAPLRTRHNLQLTATAQEKVISPPSPPPPAKKACLSPDLFIETPVKERAKTRVDNSENVLLPTPVSRPAKEHNAVNTDQVMSQETEVDEPIIPPAMMSIMHSKLIGRSNLKGNHDQTGSVITRGYDGFGGSTTFVHAQALPRGSFLKHAQQKKKSGLSVSKKTLNPHPSKLLSNQQRIKDCMKTVSSAKESLHKPVESLSASALMSDVLPSLSSSSSSSSSSPLNIFKKVPSSTSLSSDAVPSLSSSSSSSSPLNIFKKKPSSSSSSLLLSKKGLKNSSSSKGFPSKLKTGMFVSKGPSLSAKSASVKKDDVIDLT